MAYHYKLETLLRVRRNYEELSQQKLAHEIFVLDNHKQYLEDLKRKRQAIVSSLEEKKKQTATAGTLSLFVDGITSKDREIGVQQNAIEAQKQMVVTARKELHEKVKERKIVERLKEKDFLAYTKEMYRKEQNENDEQAVLRFGKEVA